MNRAFVPSKMSEIGRLAALLFLGTKEIPHLALVPHGNEPGMTIPVNQALYLKLITEEEAYDYGAYHRNVCPDTLKAFTGLV